MLAPHMALLRTSCARLTPYVSSILDFLLPPPPPPPSASLGLVGPGLEGVPAWALHAAALEQQRAGLIDLIGDGVGCRECGECFLPEQTLSDASGVGSCGEKN
jgi:hypothetical protein